MNNSILILSLITIGQLIAMAIDTIFNDGKGLGIILMVTIVCHLLNNKEDNESDKTKGVRKWK